MKAMRMACHHLVSNWAYTVIAGLAWTLKAWFALALPAERGPWHQRHPEQKRLLVTMEFRRFANALIRVPWRMVKTGRRDPLMLVANAKGGGRRRALSHCGESV